MAKSRSKRAKAAARKYQAGQVHRANCACEDCERARAIHDRAGDSWRADRARRLEAANRQAGTLPTAHPIDALNTFQDHQTPHGALVPLTEADFPNLTEQLPEVHMAGNVHTYSDGMASGTAGQVGAVLRRRLAWHCDGVSLSRALTMLAKKYPREAHCLIACIGTDPPRSPSDVGAELDPPVGERTVETYIRVARAYVQAYLDLTKQEDDARWPAGPTDESI